MHAVALAVLEKWVENEGFNPECMADADYSCSTTILLALTPDAQLNGIESMGIGLIVCQHGAPLGQISSMLKLIKYIHSLLDFKRVSFTPQSRMYCMIIGNYSGHLAYTTDPPFCVAYALDFINKNDPAARNIQEPGQPPSCIHGRGSDHMPATCVGLPRAQICEDQPQWMTSYS